MGKNINLILILSCSLLISDCNSQAKNSYPQKNPKTLSQKLVGGGCDGCELMYFEMPKIIINEYTSIGWANGKQKLLLTGKVLQIDGKTPAQNVIIYFWHTDDKGLYSTVNQQKLSTKHGKLRGWVRTDQNGEYTIKTSRPASYPAEDIPQHIHLAIKEPKIANEYYADLYFDDDPLYLKHQNKYGKQDRAGTELLRPLLIEDMQVAEHDIILGLNIPDYPKEFIGEVESGLNIGEDQPSFTPFHTYGPDKGTKTCPVCKYGRFHGILYFVGNKPNWSEIKKWLLYLEQESVFRSKYLKAYFVYGNEKSFNKEMIQKELEKIGDQLNLKNIALTLVPSMADTHTETNLNKINPNVENTFIIYKYRTIVGKFINLQATTENFKIVSDILDKTKGAYFNLAEPKHN